MHITIRVTKGLEGLPYAHDQGLTNHDEIGDYVQHTITYNSEILTNIPIYQ